MGAVLVVNSVIYTQSQVKLFGESPLERYFIEDGVPVLATLKYCNGEPFNLSRCWLTASVALGEELTQVLEGGSQK